MILPVAFSSSDMSAEWTWDLAKQGVWRCNTCRLGKSRAVFWSALEFREGRELESVPGGHEVGGHDPRGSETHSWRELGPGRI